MQPAWSNLFENVATVQFVHRCLALLLTLLISSLWIASRRSGDDRIRRACCLLLVTLAIQITLGITTLIYSVPVALAAAHQGGALVIYHGVKIRGRTPFFCQLYYTR